MCHSFGHAFLFSCSQDGRKDIVQDKSQTTLNFHFKTGAGDPVHYTRATIQDTDEASLQTLQYFQFSDDGNTLIESEYIGDVNAAVIGSNSTTSVVIKNGNDYVYARHFDSNAVGSYMFYFVANHPEITRAEASSVATLKAFVLSGKLKADGSSTPMDLMLPHLDGQDATSSANRYRMPMAGVAERGEVNQFLHWVLERLSCLCFAQLLVLMCTITYLVSKLPQ